MKKNGLILIATIIALSVVITSCKKDEDTSDEFIASDETFSNFTGWTVGGEYTGADPALGPAHGGNDSTTTRTVYFKNNVVPTAGVYPTGAVIVKHSHNTNGQVNEHTAMVKRGNNFNPSGNDWEYFVLTELGNIAEDGEGNILRGANLMNGMCLSCHEKASTDYIFTNR